MLIYISMLHWIVAQSHTGNIEKTGSLSYTGNTSFSTKSYTDASDPMFFILILYKTSMPEY